jgi:multiple sugar transport system substrate-binding protein
MSTKKISRRDMLRAMGLTAAGAALAACQTEQVEVTREVEKVVKETVVEKETVVQEIEKIVEATAVPTPVPYAPYEEGAELVFAQWGEEFTKKVADKAMADFAEATGNKTELLFLPGGQEYRDKMQAMAAANTLPDVFYWPYVMLANWAQDGIVADLTENYAGDPEADIEQLVEVTRFKIGDRIFGTGACTEPFMMFYNTEIFDNAGEPYPPATVEDAWTWDEFIEVAQRLTVDENGNHPTDAGFDPDNVQTFGADFPKWGGHPWSYMYGIWSHGGSMYSADLNSIFPDFEIAVEVIQNIADTYGKHRVTPSPEWFGESGMNQIQMLQTGRLAMFHTGNWSLEAISQSDIPYGEAVVPRMGDEYKVWARSDAIGMSAKSQYPNAAWALHKYVVFGEYSMAFSRTGVWQPHRVDLLTTEEGRRVWMTVGVHTPEHVTAASLPAVYNAKRVPARIGTQEWIDKFLTPAIGPVWSGQRSAREALEEAVPKINEFLQENPNWAPSA